MKKLITLLSFFTFALTSIAQELNCKVDVLYPTVQGVEPRIFQSLEDAVFNFMNNRKWTKDKFEIEERIDCNMLITVNSVTNNTDFSCNLQIQSSRIVFNSNYASPLLNFIDTDFDFNFLENTLLEFSPDVHKNNLTSVLAYYAYIIIGTDYDSFSPEGGTEYFNIAQKVVSNAQNASQTGWKAFEGTKNRFWLVENTLHNSFKPLRKCMYDYHRNGMDVMYQNSIVGRNMISDAIDQIKRVHQVKPLAYNTQLFFLAKADELLNVFSEAPAPEKTSLYNTLQIIDPANLNRYNQLKKGK